MIAPVAEVFFAVQDDAQRGLTSLVGVADDADRAFCGRKRLVAGQEAEFVQIRLKLPAAAVIRAEQERNRTSDR